MRKTMFGAALATAALVSGMAPPATADRAVTIYSGTWTNASRCFNTAAQLDGHWRMVLKSKDTATWTINVFVEGEGHHASWGSGQFVQGAEGSNLFDVSGGPFRFVLDSDGLLTYTIENFPCKRTETSAPEYQTVTLYGARVL